MSPILGIWASAFAKTAPDTGSYFPLGEFTLASDQATVEFTNIPQTYTHLQIRGIARSTASGTGVDGLLMQFNGDTTSNYARHNLIGDGSSATATAASTTTVIVPGQIPRSGNTADVMGVFVCDILDYRSTNKAKTTRSLLGYDLNGSGQVRLSSGLWFKTPEAITSIKLTSESNNIAAKSAFQLYGVLA